MIDVVDGYSNLSIYGGTTLFLMVSPMKDSLAAQCLKPPVARFFLKNCISDS